MPRGDGTGPMGMGRMTGRGAGYCAGFATPGYANPVGFAGGFGCGFGGGRGFRRMFYATGMPGWARYGAPAYAGVNGEAADERELLNSQAEFLEKELQQVKKRLSRLKEGEE
jgi:hypothetical protein